MKAIGYAFWSYDLFPFYVGAEFAELEGKRARVPSFGYNSWVTPKFVLGIKAGRKLKDNLESLTLQYREGIGQVNEEFKARLNALILDSK